MNAKYDASIQPKQQTPLLALPAPKAEMELLSVSDNLTVALNCSDESPFICKHSEATIKLYLDLIHGLTIDKADVVQLMELVLFLVDDDKYSK